MFVEYTVVTLITILIGLGLIALTLLYFRGWIRLRRRRVRFASFFRLFVFCFAVAMIALAFFSPLQWWHDQYFFARVGQTIALCLLAAPALFVSCAFDVALWGLPPARRRAVGRRIRSHGKVNQALRRLTQPWLTIFLFLALYVLWYDPGISNWLLVRPTAHLLGLVVVWGGALLFWWHIVSTGPRLHREFSPWLAALAMLLLEMANMATSMTIVFAAKPIYAHYAAVASVASGGGALPDADGRSDGGRRHVVGLRQRRLSLHHRPRAESPLRTPRRRPGAAPGELGRRRAHDHPRPGAPGAEVGCEIRPS